MTSRRQGIPITQDTMELSKNFPWINNSHVKWRQVERTLLSSNIWRPALLTACYLQHFAEMLAQSINLGLGERHFLLKDGVSNTCTLTPSAPTI